MSTSTPPAAPDGSVVFLVEGYVGSHDDYVSWLVRAFASQAEAEKLVVRLEAWCHKHGCHRESSFDAQAQFCSGFFGAPDTTRPMPPEDAKFRTDLDSGTGYHVRSVPFTP